MGKRVFVKISTSMVGFPRVSFREGKLVIEPIIAGKRWGICERIGWLMGFLAGGLSSFPILSPDHVKYSHRIHVCMPYMVCHLPSIYPSHVSICLPYIRILWDCQIAALEAHSSALDALDRCGDPEHCRYGTYEWIYEMEMCVLYYIIYIYMYYFILYIIYI